MSFGHRRLSIIDLESGQQPMGDGGGNWITYNGETYNYVELRAQLSGSAFRTQSDTEVLLHAYRKWGPDCLAELRGMFAFVLWDEAEQMLFCARDRPVRFVILVAPVLAGRRIEDPPRPEPGEAEPVPGDVRDEPRDAGGVEV